MEDDVAGVEGVDIRLILLIEFVVLAPLHVGFEAEDITQGLCGLKAHSVRRQADFLSLNLVNRALRYGEQSLEALLATWGDSYHRFGGTARSIDGDHLSARGSKTASPIASRRTDPVHWLGD